MCHFLRYCIRRKKADDLLWQAPVVVITDDITKGSDRLFGRPAGSAIGSPAAICCTKHASHFFHHLA